MCDTRWSQRPLYQYVLDINLPASEKLVLLSVASYREARAHIHSHVGIMHPDQHNVQEDTGLPAPVVSKILRVLYDAGYIAISGGCGGNESYIAEPLLPLFFEYFSLSRILSCVNEDEVADVLTQLDEVSLEIRGKVPLCNDREMEKTERLFPGLYRTHIQPWVRMELIRGKSELKEARK
jgi:hypothetical protein